MVPINQQTIQNSRNKKISSNPLGIFTHGSQKTIASKSRENGKLRANDENARIDNKLNNRHVKKAAIHMGSYKSDEISERSPQGSSLDRNFIVQPKNKVVRHKNLFQV
jgi:hypothetical protein